MCWNLLWMRAASAVLLAATCITAPIFGAESDPSRSVVVDQLPKRAIVTLGEFSQGRGAKVAITLRNVLDRPLSILSISSDCGCLRVDHDPKARADDGSLQLDIELAASQKAGRIRRNLRVFFEQEPTSPLDIGLDTLVKGPLAFHTPQVEISSTGDPIEIAGNKSSPEIEVLDCKPTRGSCRVLGLEQSSNGFSIRAEPLISFGRVSELFRVRYQRHDGSEPTILELPLELRCNSTLRFFPSVAPIRFDKGVWRCEARFVLAPGSAVDFEQLQLSIEREDGSLWSDSDYRVDIVKTSVVLYGMQIRCLTPHHDSDRPARLKVASPNGKLLATLDFSSL